MKLVSVGMDGLEKFLDLTPATKVLTAALPHHTDYIEKHGFQVFHYLLDELEEKILVELRKILAGQEADEADVRRASEVRAKLEEYRNLNDKQELPSFPAQ